MLTPIMCSIMFHHRKTGQLSQKIIIVNYGFTLQLLLSDAAVNGWIGKLLKAIQSHRNVELHGVQEVELR